MNGLLHRLSALAASVMAATGAWAFSIDLRTASISVEDENNASQKLAAEELEHHLRLVCPDRKPNNQKAFFIGKAPSSKLAAPGEYWSYAMAVGGRIYLWGDDSAGRNGSLFATYLFIEDVLGVRWVRPGEDGIVCKPMKTAGVDDKWRRRYRPPLELSRLRCFEDGGFSGSAYFIPNALRMPETRGREFGRQMKVWLRRMRHENRAGFTYGHAFVNWNRRYLHEHPDYLALDENGRRGLPNAMTAEAHSRVQPCLSSPGAQEQIIADWIAAGARKYLNICPNDSMNHCRCRACCAWDADLPGEDFNANKSDRYLRFCNEIAARARARRKDVVVVTYIYSNWRHPPRREKVRFPDNVLAGIVPSLEEDSCKLIEAWRAAGLKAYFVRPNYLCYTGAVPRGYERHLCEDFRSNFALGMVGVDHDHFSRHGVMDFEYYALARMMADPKLPFETIENEFLSQFGVAEKDMREYYARIRKRGEADLRRRIDAPPGKRKADRVLDDSLLSLSPYEAHNEHELRTDFALLEKALGRRGLGEAERRRIEEVRLRHQHAILTGRFVKFSQGGEDRAKFNELGHKLLEFRIRHMDDMPDNWGSVMRGFPVECRLWIKTRWYHAEHPEVSTYPKPTADDLPQLPLP